MNTVRKIFTFVVLIALSPLSGMQVATAATWTSGSGIPTNSSTWVALASSADGVVVVAAMPGGKIYYSSNSAATWLASNSPNLNWRRITASADGMKMIASASNNGGSAYFIYRSVDSGATWTVGAQDSDVEWLGVASNSDGTKLAAVARNGCPITSVNSGATWIARNLSFTSCGTASLAHLSSDETGQYLAATTNNSTGIYTSSDFGVTWTRGVVTGNPSWNNIASSADGLKLVANSSDKGVFTSNDRGASWVKRLPNSLINAYWGLASDPSGNNLVVGTTAELYASNDAGLTWFAQSRSGDWRAVASASTDGLGFVAAKSGTGANIFAGTFDFTAPADTTAPVLSSTSASSVTTTGATLNFTSNEAGTYYYLVFAAADSAPSSTTVEAQGTSVTKGSSSTTTSAKSVSTTGLTASTSYKAYVIVKDVAGNKSLVSTIAFTTAAVVKTSQTITFAEPAAMFVGEKQTVTATSTSGLVVTLTAINGAICTVSGYEITAVSAGYCSLRADQEGNSSYLLASSVNQRFVVSAVSTGPSAEEIAAAEAARVAAAAAAEVTRLAAEAAAAAEVARLAGEAAAGAEIARLAAEAAAAAEVARLAAAAIVQAKAELNKLFAVDSAPTIAQYREAEYTITTQASFDRITAAVAKLPVVDRQDATKIAALIKAIEFDESFFNPIAPPSIDTYTKNGIVDVTPRTLPTVNSKVLQIVVEQRSDVVAIQQIATVENFVDQIANPKTRGNVPSSVFVGRGLIAADNPHKDALVAAVQGLLAKVDETSVNTLEEIAAVVTRVNAIILKLPVADRTDSAKIAIAVLEEAKSALDSVLAGSTPLTIDQLRFANYTITTKASFDRIAAALAKLPVADRQDESKRSALIKAIELDESFFNASVRPNLATYLSYGVTGVTERTLSTVNAQLLLLPGGQRADLIAIQKIADVENFVDLIANPQTRASATVSSFVTIGLITAENPNKESVVAALKSFDEYSLSTLTKVATAINAINTAVLALAADERSSSSSIAVLSTTLAAKQTFVDRVSNVQTRPSVGSSEFITRKLMPSDTPYKYSVVVGLQGYSETSLDSMDKIAAAIKAEIVKAQQRRALTSKIKASIAAKRG